MSNNFKSNKNDAKVKGKQVEKKEIEITQLKNELRGKTEHILRLNEQYSNSQKPALYGLLDNTKSLNTKSDQINKLKTQLADTQRLESQYNSDKQIFRMNLEELQIKLDKSEYQLTLVEESKNDVDNLWKTCENQLKTEQEKNVSLQRENESMKNSFDKVGSETN